MVMFHKNVVGSISEGSKHKCSNKNFFVNLKEATFTSYLLVNLLKWNKG